MKHKFEIKTNTVYASSFEWEQKDDAQAMESARFNAKNFSANTEGGTWAKCSVILSDGKKYIAVARQGVIMSCYTPAPSPWSDA